MRKPEAVIFDMDGTLIDNNQYHFMAWQHFYRLYNRTLSPEEYKTNITGRTSVDILQTFFGKSLTPEEITTYSNEKNTHYRQMYTPHIKPVKGLISLLDELKKAGIPMTVATSGSPANVRFLFQHIPIEHYFEHVINASNVVQGKPNPEIFLKAAGYTGVAPAHCIVFEDSFAGIAAAKAAGMKVVGLTTTEPKEKLTNTDAVIDNFTQVNLSMLETLFL